MGSPESQRRRKQALSRMSDAPPGGGPPLDLLVIGGGITGAGIVWEAARRGLRCALLEARDFAWGTSSRSSRMVHGGLRYLVSGQITLSFHAVRERDRLLRQLPGLVEPMGFLMPHYRGRWPHPLPFRLLLGTYDLLSRRRRHQALGPDSVRMLAPGLAEQGLRGATRHEDAVTDDARLVYRLIQEARDQGALAVNYVQAEGFLEREGRVHGVIFRDALSGERGEARASVVVNATGPWVDQIRGVVGARPMLRPLKGSHLVFPFWRLPVAQCITLLHPRDGRPVFVLPWEGVSVVGNTDMDFKGDLDMEPGIGRDEADYLLEAVNTLFPDLRLDLRDLLSTYSGVRPIIRGGALNPSRERRDHRIWMENGLVSVSGGKLTTFALIAREVLQKASPWLPRQGRPAPWSDRSSGRKGLLALAPGLGAGAVRRLLGRYGGKAGEVVKAGGIEERFPVPGTYTLWCELRWAARKEDVEHVDDLLLRRTRLGLLRPDGGADILDRVESICREELGWDASRWQRERMAYEALWKKAYGLPHAPEGSVKRDP